MPAHIIVKTIVCTGFVSVLRRENWTFADSDHPLGDDGWQREPRKCRLGLTGFVSCCSCFHPFKKVFFVASARRVKYSLLCKWESHFFSDKRFPSFSPSFFAMMMMILSTTPSTKTYVLQQTTTSYTQQNAHRHRLPLIAKDTTK